MDLDLSEEALALKDTVDRLFVKHADLGRVREVEPQGFDRSLWSMLLELDLPRLGVAAALGGQGADMRTMSALAESIGRHLAPVPAIESMVAARLLAKFDRLEAVEKGSLVTLALRPIEASAAQLVPAGSVADHVVAYDGSELLLVEHPLATEVAVLGSMPLADLTIDDTSTQILATGTPAREAFDTALDEWRTLTAVALSALSAEGLRIGVEYAKNRNQFGVPIGSFQAVSQAFADHATATQGARLLAYEAAWATDVGSSRAALLSSMAFVFAARTAQRSTAHALHVHGGYGFMLEYDIQLYFRRAKGWPLAIGPMPAQVELVAARALDGTREGQG